MQVAVLPAMAAARALIHDTDDITISEQCEAASIPAPPFGESVRGAWIAGRFEKAGLSAVRTDSAGNVIGEIAGTDSDAMPVVVAAHLDTVFPADTPLELKRRGRRILLPGISDNARGLAAILAIVRVVRASGLRPRAPVLLVATTGEEGVGDLRGVKHLLGQGSVVGEAAAFIALDGTDSRRVVTRAVGSTRYRLTVRGPGGHAWADRGTANAGHALGIAIASLARLRVPSQPGSALNVGRLGGGTSINAIPERAWLELDLRSEDAATLADLAERALDATRDAVREANMARRSGTSPLELEVERIGARPAGSTDPDSRVVRSAKEATRFIGRRPELVASSTDANVPMSLGIPSIAMGCGGESGGMHTVGEWYENVRGPEGIVRALLTIFGTAGIQPE